MALDIKCVMDSESSNAAFVLSYFLDKVFEKSAKIIKAKECRQLDVAQCCSGVMTCAWCLEGWLEESPTCPQCHGKIQYSWKPSEVKTHCIAALCESFICKFLCVSSAQPIIVLAICKCFICEILYFNQFMKVFTLEGFQL